MFLTLDVLILKWFTIVNIYIAKISKVKGLLSRINCSGKTTSTVYEGLVHDFFFMHRFLDKFSLFKNWLLNLKLASYYQQKVFLRNLLWRIYGKCFNYIETITLIYIANQLSGFHIMVRLNLFNQVKFLAAFRNFLFFWVKKKNSL